MQMANGVARKVDQLGRVVLPVEMRKALGIDVGDLVMMSDEGDRIVLEKVEQRCVFCGSTEQPLREFTKKLVCNACVEKLSATSA
jgi:transcriptional pleiotropic regulator of transition state genes